MAVSVKPTLADLRRAAQALGAAVEADSSGPWTVLQLCAPAGKVWACAGDAHMLEVVWRDGDPGYREASIRDALGRVALGLADCDDPDCGYCSPE